MSDDTLTGAPKEGNVCRHERFELFDTATVEIDGTSHKCAVTNLSVGGAAVIFEVELDSAPPFGKSVMLDIGGLGEMNGYVARSLKDGIAVHLNVSPRRRNQLAALMMKGLNDILFADEDA